MLDKIFGSHKKTGQENKKNAWNDLRSEEDVSRIAEESYNRPQLIFKHSTRCGISQMVWSRSRTAFETHQEDADLYYLDLLSFRQASNAVAAFFGIPHESPQLLIIRDGKVVAHASHGDITNSDFKELLA